MKIALVTGATSGIGRAFVETLLNKNYIVYGIGRDFSKNIIENKNFIPISCDLRKLDEIQGHLNNLKNIDFSLIINSAGLGYFAPHEELNISKIRDMISVNLQAPLIISQFFLRTLKKNKGTIINISSVTAKKISPLGAAYSATKAGLSHFGESLFEEVRKYGVKVVTLHPDMTKTDFYRDNFFDCDDNRESYIDVVDLANTLDFILNQNENIVFTDITIKPQKHNIKKKGFTKK